MSPGSIGIAILRLWQFANCRGGLISEAQDLVDDDCDPRVEWDVLVTYFEVACDENVEVDRLGASANRCFCEYLLYINERSLMTVLRVCPETRPSVFHP